MSCLNRCPLCPRNRNVIPPDGPLGSKVMFVGESPGREENGRGRPFIGKTGLEFNSAYLPLAGLNRDSIYLTNSIKCQQDDLDLKKKEDRALFDSCTQFHLKHEIEVNEPDLLVLMGGVACKLAGDELNLEMHHGFPQSVRIFDRKRDVFPMYHPALGLHSTDMMLPIRADFIRLREFLMDQLEIPTDEHPNPIYRMIRDVAELDFWFPADAPEIAIDTETDLGRPWCMTFSGQEGTGFLIRANQPALLQRFKELALSERRRVSRYGAGPRILIHNAMFDLGVLAEMGLPVPMNRLVDTMMESYHLGDLPQALKVLAYRLRGMRMREYEDVVLPYARAEQLDYILRAAEFEYEKPEPRLEQDDITGEWKMKKPQSMSTKLKRLLTDYGKNPELNLQERFFNWSCEDRRQVIANVGDFPKPTIAQVPLNEAIDYACCDADATLRVWQRIKARERRFHRSVVPSYRTEAA